MFLFYTPDIEFSHYLSEEESAHCVRVLRLTEGDDILLTDGKGTTYDARITKAHPKKCEFEILNSEQQKKHWNYNLHIAIAPTKNIERLEWMVEKCTEIGVDEITPLICRFSERKQVKLERLERVMISAAKQSLKAYMPKLNDLIDFDSFVAHAHEQNKFIAHCYKNDKTQLAQALQKTPFPKDILVLIGPEGDFSEQEVLNALNLGFKPVALGDERLRTETAGVVACHTTSVVSLLSSH